ncbi:MerR family transcriptional regulator [uncultured Pyramidobacter sp.]|uniref:MerR family transcriptional regulator n=1 Tax=uncultured Pyramidobacter sp. TaxID=1623495 RepID=UPI0025895B70|nr:MerR family transcriptional regulator [uncultured Pyramidobacter sp.]
MTDGEKRFTIGQMAELCNVSAKQLRHYDANGILAPARRDPQSGYRFYTENQIEEILLIQEMHAIGLSLKDIGSLLNRRDLSSLRLELEQGLAAARDELERARRKYDRTVEVLLRVMHAMEHRAAPLAQEREIRLADVPARTVAFTRYVSSWNAKKLFIQRRAELYKIAARHGLHMTGANMAIFHSGYLKQFSDDPADGEGDLEICIRVVDLPGNCPTVRTIPAFRAVTALYGGDYRAMKPRYLEMERWAAEHGVALAGTSLEEYLVGASMTRHREDYVTRLYLPVRGCAI